MGKTKMELIQDILKKLKPNTYQPDRPEWVDIQSGLLRMNNRELNATYILLLCKKDE
jgi:hypothetical protein